MICITHTLKNHPEQLRDWFLRVCVIQTMIFRKFKAENRKFKNVSLTDFNLSRRRRNPEGNRTKSQGEQFDQKKSRSAPLGQNVTADPSITGTKP